MAVLTGWRRDVAVLTGLCCDVALARWCRDVALTRWYRDVAALKGSCREVALARWYRDGVALKRWCREVALTKRWWAAAVKEWCPGIFSAQFCAAKQPHPLRQADL